MTIKKPPQFDTRHDSDWHEQKVPNPFGTSKIQNPNPPHWKLKLHRPKSKYKIKNPNSKIQNSKSKHPTARIVTKWPKIQKSNTQNPSQKFEFWLYGLVVFDFQHTKAQAAGELSEQQRAVNLDPAARRTEEMQRRLREAKKKILIFG